MSTPSFSSFPASFSSFPDLDAGPSSRSPAPSTPKSDEDKHVRKARKIKRDKHSRKHKGSTCGDDRGRNGSLGVQEKFEDERLKAEEDRQRLLDLEKPLPLFYSDYKGDPSNVTFGSLHVREIPKYRLVGGGKKILGLSAQWSVFRRTGKEVEVGIAHDRVKAPVLTDPNSRALLDIPPSKRLVRTDSKHKYKEIDGFLRFPSHSKDLSFCSITHQDAHSGSDSSSEGSILDDDSDLAPMPSHQEKLRSLEEELSSDPRSILTWLSLLSHTLSTIPLASKNASKTRSDITLSILSRALSAHPDNNSSSLIRIKHLRAGEEIWHESKLRAEWEDALKIGGIEIWIEWLEWRIKQAKDGVDGLLQDAQRIFEALAFEEEDEIARVRVFWRIAVAFHNAGYTERCMAMFQAQVELSFHTPQAYCNQPLEAQLDALEQFWETELPRVGQPGAKGWAAWIPSSDAVAAQPSSSLARPMDTDAISDPYIQWATLESHLDRVLKVPLRSDDASEDPYSVILFSDIRTLLFPLRSTRAKHALRLAWLSVIGLHIPGFTTWLGIQPYGCCDDRWAYMHLITAPYLSQIFPPSHAPVRFTADAHAGVLIGREKEYAKGFGPVRNWSQGVLGPLDFVDEEKSTLWRREDVEGEGFDAAFVRRVFEQVRLGNDDYEWNALAVAFEAAISLKGATKLSRLLLSNARESLPRWQFHARLEFLRGRPDDARKVYSTILIASPPAGSPPFVSSLWWNWAEMEWLEREPEAALQVILKAARVSGKTGVMILRAKRNLDDAIATTADEQWKDREAWVNLRALLELLTSSINSALEVYDAHMEDKETRPVALESLTVASLLMLYRHGTILRNPTPPALLRGRAEQALAAYPNNTIILGLFLHAEKGHGVWGKVRGILGDNAAQTGTAEPVEKDVARRTAEIWIAGWEKNRWEAEIERTRSGLSAAVDNDRTKGSWILWRLWVEFEIRIGQLQRAKNVLFRAIKECPLNKGLYLLAFGALRSVFKPPELDTFAEIMAERQIRMRTELDVLLEGWKVVDMEEDDDDDDSSGADSEIGRAQELRRLMPY